MLKSQFRSIFIRDVNDSESLHHLLLQVGLSVN
jgi:hypothetical protein